MEPARNDLPRRCGRYILLERLGEGGMAEVYKARLAQSEGPDRVLVVKLLPPDAAPSAAARFIDEAKIALPLTHGNITATFEFGRAENRPFLVMEYVNGLSLRQILDALNCRGETASVPASLFLGREVARALRYAHHFVDDQGLPTPIVHRDVSPENVLVSRAGQVKLTDFGIARSSHALDLATAWGKPAYVAPEILEADPGSPASDVYSLGCVLYEMLSGWPPLLGKSDEETLRMVRHQRPIPLSQLRDDLPESLSNLLEQVLEKDPDARRGDAAEIEVALSRLLSREASHYTEADLSATLSRLFERVDCSDEQDVLLAERLRGQLSDAGVATSGRESASEMLALGTVDLSSDPPPLAAADDSSPDATVQIPSTDRRRRWLGLLSLAGALLVIIASGLALALWPARSNPTTMDAAAPDAGIAVAAVVDASAPSPDAELQRGTDGGTAGDAADAGVGDDSPRSKRRRWRRPATVTFNSHPWSFVYVDGRKLPGHTPILNVSLPPGRHRVRFVNPELSLSKSTALRLAPGEERFVKMRLPLEQQEDP